VFWITFNLSLLYQEMCLGEINLEKDCDLQCHMLKVATGKLKLEHLVIEKGHFKQEKEPAKVVLKVRFQTNS
jgi:hypothetical protein